MAVQTELDLSRERKQVDDLTAAFDRLQTGAARTNRTNLKDLEAQVDALSTSAAGSLRKMLQGLKGNLQELDGMLTATGRQVGVAWKTVAADTLARVNADMSKVKLVYQTRFEEAGRAAVAAATKMAADIQAAERRMLSAGSSGVASAATARTRVAGSTNARGLFTPAQPQLDVKAYIPTTAVPQVNALSQAFRKLTVDGNDVHSAMRGLASGFNLLWLTWGNLAPLFAGASISFGVTKTFEIGSEVEHNINMLQVLGDKTKEQGSVIREELRKIDQTTLFSLKELSKTMVDLEQAGISGADALKLVKTSADLAAVGNTNLDVTSKLLTQTMGVFPETAADITKAAAQMFQATKDGKLDINNIGESMRYASTANLMYGQSLEDTLVALQALASVGIKETQAGTSFVNMLQDLTGRTKPAKKALAELETALGRTIKAFDAKGKARPFLDVVSDIQEALEKFKPEKALDLANKAFTERGLRLFFSSIARGTTDLSAYKKTLESIDPSSLGKAAAKVMDTTKGAMDQLRGSLVGVLDRTFESMDSRFKDSLKRMTAMIDSEEFRRMLRGLVSGVVALGEAAITYMPAITKLGAAFAAFKALALVQPMLLGAASALAGLIGFLNLGSVQMGRMAGSAAAGATSIGALGASMIVTAASSRAAAAGLGVVQVEAAGAAAKLTVAAGAGRAAAVVLGFLANPIVGVITTLGLLAYTFSSVSKSSQSASEELTSKIYKDGKVNIDILNQEIAKINERNVVAASRSGKATVFDAPADEALSKYKSATDKLQKLESTVVTSGAKRLTDEDRENQRRRLDSAKAEQKIAYDNWHALHFARQKVLDQSEKLETEAETKRQKGVQAAIERDKKNRERELSGLEGSPDVTGKFARSHTTAIKHIKDNLESIASSSQAAIAQLTDTYNTERDILKNAHGNQLIDEGTYQAKSLAQLQAYEANKLALLDDKDEASRMEVVRVYEENTKVLSKQLAQAKGTADEQLVYRVEKEKEFSEEMNRVGEKVRSDLANSQTERVKLTNEAVKSMTVAYQDYEGVVKKLDLKTDEEILAIRLRREEAEATENLARQYDGVTTSSMAFLQAQKASALASATAQAEAQKHLETVDKAIALAEKASESFSKFITEKNIPWTDEVINALRGRDMEIEALRRNRAKYLGEATTDIAAAGKRAFDSVIAEDLQHLKAGTSEAIMTGLFEGGKAGKDSLRKLIIDELKKPVRLIVDAFINPIVGALMGSFGLSATASAAGTAAGSAAGSFGASTLGTAVFGPGGVTGFASNLSAGISSTLSGWTGGGASVSAIGQGSTAFNIGAGVPYVGAALLALNALGVFRSKKIVGGGLSGTLGEGDIQSYDLQRKGGTLFSGPSYSVVNQQKSAWSEMIQADWKRVTTSVVEMATALNLSTEAAKGFTATLGTDVIHPDTGGLGINLDDLKGKNLTDEQYATEVQKRINAALAAGSEELAQKLIGSWKDGKYVVSEFARASETALETLTRLSSDLTAVNSTFKLLGFELNSLSLAGGDASSTLVEAYGGRDSFTQLFSSFYDSFYTEAEKRANTIRQITEELVAAGAEVTEADVGRATLAEFGDITKAIIRTNGAADPLAMALVKVSGRFAEVNKDVDQLSETMKSLQNESATLEIELLKAQGKLSEASSRQRTVDTAGMTAAEIAIYDYNQALKAQTVALTEANETAKTRAAEVKAEQDNLNRALLQALGDTDALRELEIQSLDDSNKAIQRHIWAIEDSQAAYEAATSRASSAYDTLERSVSAERERLDKTFDAEKLAISQRLEAQKSGYQAQIAAAESAAAKIREVASVLSSALNTVKVDSPTASYNRYKSAQAVLATGDINNPKLSEALSLVSGDNKQFYGTFEAYAFDQAVTSAHIRSMNATAQSQLSTAEALVNSLKASDTLAQTLADAELAALEEKHREDLDKLQAQLELGKSQLDALLGINNSVLSVTDAVTALGGAISAAYAAQAAQIAATTAARTAGATSTAGASGSSDAFSAARAGEKEWLNSLTGKFMSGLNLDQSAASDYATLTSALGPKFAGFQVGSIAESILGLSAYTQGGASSSVRSEAEMASELLAVAKRFGIPGFDTGINRVPHDMFALIHEDEAVLPARYNPFNPAAQTYSNTSDSEVVAELRAISERLARVESSSRATAAHTAAVDRKLARVIKNDAISTKETV